MVSKKYKAEFKIRMVKEYLERRESDPKLTKADFAFEKKISDSTFNDWVIKYQKMGSEFANVTSQIEVISAGALGPAPIVRYEGVVPGELAKDMVRVTCNGIAVEFNECLAERILGIIKSW